MKKQVYSHNFPIFILQNYVKKSIELAIGKKLSNEIINLITIELTPKHISGDFTVSIFQIAKLFGLDYSKLAPEIAQNLQNTKKYIKKVEVINGFINISIEPQSFYIDSLESIVKQPQPIKSELNIRGNILVIEDQTKFKDSNVKPYINFINNLYNNSKNQFLVEKKSLSDNLNSSKINSFIRTTLKRKITEDLGNNVIVLPGSDSKPLLLQKQNKTPTLFMEQLICFYQHITVHNPAIVILIPDIKVENLNEIIFVLKKLNVINDKILFVILDKSEIENSISFSQSRILNRILSKNKNVLEKSNNRPFELIEFENFQQDVIHLLSYYPEIIRKALDSASANIILNYIHICKTYSEKYLKSTREPQNNNTDRLILRTINNIFETSIKLFEG